MSRNTGETAVIGGNGADEVDILNDDPNADTGSIAAILSEQTVLVEDPIRVVLDITAAGLDPYALPIRLEFAQNTGGQLTARQAFQLSLDLRTAHDVVDHVRKMKKLDEQQ